MTRKDPANCPIRAGSLTAVPRMAERSAVTKSQEGKSPEKGMTRSQPKRQDEDTGRRKTNDRRHRKGELAAIADRASEQLGGRSPVRWEKSDITWEVDGREHQVTRRCKRRRHVLNDSLSNWGGPARFRQRSGVKTTRWVDPFNQPSALAEASLPRTGTRGCLGISCGIKQTAESRGEVLQGIGDAHSSADDKDNITLSERRGISLRKRTMERGGLA